MKKVLALLSSSYFNWMFRPQAQQRLRDEFVLVQAPDTRPLDAADWLTHLHDCHALITGWDSPRLTREVLQAAHNLEIIAHAAGSVKILFDQSIANEVLLPRGIKVYSGNDAIARNVAESTIGLMVMASHHWLAHINGFYRNQRRDDTLPLTVLSLTGATVGLISASRVARHAIVLLQPFGCRVLVYDPFLSESEARDLNVELCGLNELFEESDFVSVHAPALPATQNLIGAAQLQKLRDGTVFINTARGSIVDHEALLDECRNGRFVAVLDVTQPEPLPPDSPFWNLPNVILTPHISGSGQAGYFGVGDGALQAICHVTTGQSFAGEVPLGLWDRIG